MLVAVREALLHRDRAVVLALHGMGGVGKTQLAVEDAHRFAAEYDLVWWIAAEQAGLIGEQFTTLGVALGCIWQGTEVTAARTAVLGVLRERNRWLLVFDNAEDPEGLAVWLPGGGGHVLITSRRHQWAEVAVPVEVDVLARAESVAILRGRVAGLSAEDADRVAAAVGDLPLGVAQAAGYMAETGIPTEEYADLLRTRAAQLMDEGRPPSYPRSLATVTQLAFNRLRGEDPAAAELAGLCAFLSSEPVPAGWFAGAATELPGPLGEKAADPVAWRQVLARLGRSALARVDQEGLRMHRLTQAILRGYLPPEQATITRALAEAILAANNPGPPGDPAAWPGWARVLPHLLALDPAASTAKLRRVAGGAALYLIRRGDAHSGHDLALQLYRQWCDQLGPDDDYTLWMATALAYALREMGRYRQARELDEDILARRRRVLGEDHPDTLAYASNLAADLRVLAETQAACELDEDILARRRRVLGEDHPDTLTSASNLAADLRALGEI